MFYESLLAVTSFNFSHLFNLQKIVGEFEKNKRRKFRLIVGKSKVKVFESARDHTVEFAKPY